MALVSMPGMKYPSIPFLERSSQSNFTFDASTDQLALVFKIPATGTIDKIHYRVTAVTSPVGTHRIELRTVDATTGLANAAGTLYGSSTSIGVNAATYAATTNYTAAVAATATAGDLVAACFDMSAFTSGSFTQARGTILPITGNTSTMFPYDTSNTAASDAKAVLSFNAIGLEYSDAAYHFIDPGCILLCTSSTAAVTNSGTTRRGNILRPPVPMRATGVWVLADLDGVVLMQLRLASDDSILATVTTDPDIRGTTGTGPEYYKFDAGTTVNLTAGTDYYVTFEGNDATGGTIFFVQNIPANGMLDQISGGKNCYGFTYAGSYSAANTTRYWIGLMIDQLDDGTSTGGGGSQRVIGG